MLIKLNDKVKEVVDKIDKHLFKTASIVLGKNKENIKNWEVKYAFFNLKNY